ncbi:MAG: ATP-dependent DNA helicase [Nanoarchaeota archaeon]|nr:ATP-dependent DNA helicase [Nanoarchaeota archaeon]MBU1270387.1 ATP-dependent DNA helicase [Nanoarchaeota archaeon]MBU1604818.1 ATP-dependent DNA helicase [Nanoarchaeota archaeon]MBU2442801.1 ATP-dependent DNA helicase [Nanoarchaeota archaeon]
MNFDSLLFPHENVREIQDKLVLKIDEVVRGGKNLIVHAPTGLGKTAASIAPCLKYAIENDKVVFFLTSRHTQHKIAMSTLSDIMKRFDKNFVAVSIVGKKGLCLQPGVSKLYTSEFNEYCRAMREDKKCEFYERLKKKDKLSTETKSAISELSSIKLVTTDESFKVAGKYGLCPYELSMLMSKNAKIIVGDYYYVFNPDISHILFKKIDKELKDAIIIVDEAHNLPGRVKDLFTVRVSNIMIKRAVSEAKKFKYEETAQILFDIGSVLNDMSDFSDDERYVKKEEFVEKINVIGDYQQLINDLSFVADAVREEQKQSYIGSVSSFLESWLGDDEGFTRIISKQDGLRDKIIVLSYRCLDPSLSTKKIINSTHSTIMMSGTLTPTYMYKELLGFEEAEEKTYSSPFPEENRLNIIIPKTSTKYELRNQKQFREIAQILAKIVNAVPGNSALFFPSYHLRDVVYKEFYTLSKKTVFVEHANLSKSEKHELLEKFKSYKGVGAVLLGVISGSFGEGIDLPGDYLKCVVVVGLPLTKPDLESKALIDYYDKKFSKGWDYGYLFPAFNKTLQSAGRCIRSETDKGVVIFLDERYSWSNYHRCFPVSWSIKTTLLYEKMIENFFSKNN